MKVTIYGLTDSTIVFNKIGITLRGNSNDLETFPESIAKHVNIDNSEKEHELNYLIKAKQVRIVNEDEVKEVKKTVPVNLPIPAMLKKKEEMPGFSPPDESETVIGTSSGAVKTTSKKDFNSPIEDDEAVKESLDAMQKLEQEEQEALQEPKEEKPKRPLDPSEEMGTEAVISTGGNNTIRKQMQRSVVGEVNVEPFIDEVEDEVVKADDERVKSAFIVDENIEADDDKYSDAFIET